MLRSPRAFEWMSSLATTSSANVTFGLTQSRSCVAWPIACSCTTKSFDACSTFGGTERIDVPNERALPSRVPGDPGDVTAYTTTSRSLRLLITSEYGRLDGATPSVWEVAEQAVSANA